MVQTMNLSFVENVFLKEVSLNSLYSNNNIHILQTVLYTFSMLLHDQIIFLQERAFEIGNHFFYFDNLLI